MAKFLLTIWPYTGHIYPNIALANALRAQGHEVAFYSGALARSVIEEEGFFCFPFKQVARTITKIVGLPDANGKNDWDSTQLYQRFSEHYAPVFEQGLLTRGKLVKAMYREWFLGTVPQQIMDLEVILAEWQPDVLVCDPFMWGPFLILHETRSTPVVIFSYFAACLIPGPDVPPFALGLPSPRKWWGRSLVKMLQMSRKLLFAEISRGADVIRQSHRLRPLSAPVMEFAGQMPLYLVASVLEFDYQRNDLPASVHYVGPCLWDKSAHATPPVWLDQLTQDRPVVYVTEGTAHTRAPILLRAAAQGLADLAAHVVMTTGLARDPAKLGLEPIGPNTRVERWVPHSDLFPKVNIVVTHGGSGTVLAALEAGIPLIIVPMQWDHLENAQRVVEAGAGLRLKPKHCTAERLKVAVEHVLKEPSFHQNARRLAAIFKRYRGAKKSVELLEDLVTKSLTKDKINGASA